MRKYQALIAVLVVAMDASTKWLVAHRIPLDGTVAVVPGLFQLTHLQNTGVAFSLFADPGRGTAIVLILFSCAAVSVISYVLWKSGGVLNVTTVALALIGGGALGNLWERVFRGSVTDFLDFYVGIHHWPPFNVADSAICVGAVLLLGTMVFGGRKQEPAADFADQPR